MSNDTISLERTLGDLAKIPVCSTDEALVAAEALEVAGATFEGTLLANEGQWLDAALIIGTSALGNEGGGTIALEIVDGDNGCVDWELLVVNSETVAVSIGVREETRLQDGVG